MQTVTVTYKIQVDDSQGDRSLDVLHFIENKLENEYPDFVGVECLDTDVT